MTEDQFKLWIESSLQMTCERRSSPSSTMDTEESDGASLEALVRCLCSATEQTASNKPDTQITSLKFMICAYVMHLVFTCLRPHTVTFLNVSWAERVPPLCTILAHLGLPSRALVDRHAKGSTEPPLRLYVLGDGAFLEGVEPLRTTFANLEAGEILGEGCGSATGRDASPDFSRPPRWVMDAGSTGTKVVDQSEGSRVTFDKFPPFAEPEKWDDACLTKFRKTLRSMNDRMTTDDYCLLIATAGVRRRLETVTDADDARRLVAGMLGKCALAIRETLGGGTVRERCPLLLAEGRSEAWLEFMACDRVLGGGEQQTTHAGTVGLSMLSMGGQSTQFAGDSGKLLRSYDVLGSREIDSRCSPLKQAPGSFHDFLQAQRTRQGVEDLVKGALGDFVAPLCIRVSPDRGEK